MVASAGDSVSLSGPPIPTPRLITEHVSKGGAEESSNPWGQKQQKGHQGGQGRCVCKEPSREAFQRGGCLAQTGRLEALDTPRESSILVQGHRPCSWGLSYTFLLRAWSALLYLLSLWCDKEQWLVNLMVFSLCEKGS